MKDIVLSELVDPAKLAEFCEKWKITQVALFGSVLREDFGPDSDIDVLVDFAPDSEWGLYELVDMEEELAAIFGRDVDLVLRRSIQASKNPYRRDHILGTARTVYVAG